MNIAEALIPMHDRVIVKRLPTENKTAGGIVIPDMAIDPPDLGKVVAVGPGRKTDDGSVIPVQVAVGDTIMFGKYAGHNVKIDGEDFVCMPECDVIAVVENAPENVSFQ